MHVYNESSCESHPYAYMLPFIEAFWEVINDVNCNSVVCNSEAVVDGRNDIGWTNQGQGARAMARALAYAMDVVSSQTNYDSVIDQMLTWLLLYDSETSSDSDFATNIQQVFDHHF